MFNYYKYGSADGWGCGWFHGGGKDKRDVSCFSALYILPAGFSIFSKSWDRAGGKVSRGGHRGDNTGGGGAPLPTLLEYSMNTGAGG